MNKKLYLTIAVLLILSFILCSCRKEAQIVPAPTETEDTGLVILQPDLSLPDEYYTSMNQGAKIWHCYLNTPYGKYHNVEGFIHYSQYGNTKFMTLCQKEDCPHMYDDCDAYVGKNIQIGYYQGNIYYVQRPNNMLMTLYKMNMDGTEHQTVKAIITDMQLSIKEMHGFFHSGYYYFVLTDDEHMGSRFNTDKNLYRIRLDDDSPYESVFCHDIIPTAYRFTLVDNNVFFYVRTGTYTEGTKNPENFAVDFELYKLSLTDNELSLLTDNWSDFTNCYFDSENGYCYKHNDGFYLLNLATKEKTKVADSAIKGGWGTVAHFCPDYIYVVAFEKTKNNRGRDRYYDDQTLYILDWEYKIVNTYNNPTSSTEAGFFIEDAGNCIVLSTVSLKPPDYFIYKSDFGMKSLKLYDIIH